MLAVNAVLMLIVPVRPPEERVIVLCPAVNICAALNEESEDGRYADPYSVGLVEYQ